VRRGKRKGAAKGRILPRGVTPGTSWSVGISENQKKRKLLTVYEDGQKRGVCGNCKGLTGRGAHDKGRCSGLAERKSPRNVFGQGGGGGRKEMGYDLTIQSLNKKGPHTPRKSDQQSNNITTDD